MPSIKKIPAVLKVFRNQLLPSSILLTVLSPSVFAADINLFCKVSSQIHLANGKPDLSPHQDWVKKSFNLKISDGFFRKSIEIVSPNPNQFELYSNTACVDNPYHKSWMEWWKRRGKDGAGCVAHANFNSEFYAGGVSTPPDYDAGSWSTIQSIKINRRSGEFEKEYISSTNNTNTVYQQSWRHFYSGTCDVTNRKF